MVSRTAKIVVFLFISVFLAQARASLQDEGFSGLAAQLQSSFLLKDSAAYANLFSPAIREREASLQRHLLEDLSLTSASFYPMTDSGGLQGSSRTFLQVILENDYLAIIQSWELLLEDRGSGRLIAAKTIRDDPGLLYKIKIPSSQVELVPQIEIRQEDISLTFTNAYVFHDNLPETETALLVLGQGLVTYQPSDPKERHQLELAYRTQKIQERIEYAFCRFSNSFFQEHIQVAPSKGAPSASPPESVRAMAAALFDKHYPRYFTVVSPLTQEPLSFLPQGEETVLEFETAKNKEFSYVFTPFAEDEVHFLEQPQSKLINLYSPAAPQDLPRMFISFRDKCDVQHYDLEASFWPKTTWLSARARISVLSSVDSLTSLKFRLNRDLRIVRILDDKGRALFFTQDKSRDLLYMYFLESYNRGDAFSFEITYRGHVVPPDQLTDVLMVGQFNDTLVLTPPKYDSFLFSLSAVWYPEASEDDFFTARQKITVPADYTCQANGLLLERSESKGPRPDGEPGLANRAVYTFLSEQPVKYLSFIVGDFDKTAETSQPLPLSYFSTPNVFMGRLDISTISQVLHFYEGLFGPYPYQKLAVVQRQWFFGGGHSPASFIVLNEPPRSVDRRLPPIPTSPVDLTRWKEYFLAHEMAHQWWGACVTWKSYQDQWLSEGLAQFSTAQFLREVYGERAYADIMEKFCQWTDKMSVWGQISLGSRLSVLKFQAYQAVIYNKTSAVLNLLLEVIGPEAFWSGMKNFFLGHRFSAARTADFIRAMEQASGRKLAPFFGPWFDSYGLPDARVVLSEVNVDQERFLQVDVSQKSEVFIYPLWLSWTEGGVRVERKIIVEAKDTSQRLPFHGRLGEVRLNPVRLVPGRLTVVR